MGLLKIAVLLIATLSLTNVYALQGYAPYKMKKNDWVSKLLIEKGLTDSSTLQSTLSVNKMNFNSAKKIAIGTIVYLPTSSDKVSATMSAPTKAETAPMMNDSEMNTKSEYNTSSESNCFNNVWVCRIHNF